MANQFNGSFPLDPPGGLRRSSLGWLCALMDEIDSGLVLWVRGGAAHLNRTALQQLREPDHALQVVDGRIRAHDARDDAQLAAALDDALARQRRRILTLRGQRGNVPVAVVPFGPGGESSDAVLLVLGKRELCPELSAHWFCTVHKLTPSESGVLADLLAGHDPQEIARRNDVALATVRSQIARISEKTSLRGIRELILTATTLPAVMSVNLKAASTRTMGPRTSLGSSGSLLPAAA